MTEHRITSLAEWRRLHKPGNPSRLDTDEELRSFVEEHISRTTFHKLAALILQRFGSERSVSPTVLHRYWSKHKERLLNNATAE